MIHFIDNAYILLLKFHFQCMPCIYNHYLLLLQLVWVLLFFHFKHCKTNSKEWNMCREVERHCISVLRIMYYTYLVEKYFVTWYADSLTDHWDVLTYDLNTTKKIMCVNILSVIFTQLLFKVWTVLLQKLLGWSCWWPWKDTVLYLLYQLFDEYKSIVHCVCKIFVYRWIKETHFTFESSKSPSVLFYF